MAKRSLALSAALVAVGLAGAAGACGDDTTTPQGSGTSGVPTFPVSPAAEGGVPAGTLGSGAPCAVVTTASEECASGICAAAEGTLTPAPPPPPEEDASVDGEGADGGADGGDGGAAPAGFCTVGCGPPGNPSLDCSGAAFTGICGGTGVCRVRAL